VILYLDTSSLVKLYVPEAGSAEVQQIVDDAEVSATSRLAYVEAKAAFARKRRERGITAAGYRTVTRDFDHDWEAFFIVDVSSEVIKFAAELAEKRALKGYDAVHLASALTLLRHSGRPVAFSCFDVRLSLAARREGLHAASAGKL
jgi:predicted nucleic acid-binding protein